MKKAKKPPLYKSFGYAFEGIFTCIRNERNIKIHCTVAILVVIAGAVLGITPTEWCICLTLFGLVIALELVNTAIESVVDLVTTERKPLAKTAKDTAAGAVLVDCFTIITGNGGFYHGKTYRRIKEDFTCRNRNSGSDC